MVNIIDICSSAYLSFLNLKPHEISQPNLSWPIVNPNGGYCFNGKAYETSLSNEKYEGGASAMGGDFNSSGSNAIYRYELTLDGLPQNKRMIGIARRGIPDCFHIGN